MRNVFSYLYNRTKNQIRVSFGRKIYFFVSWTSFRDFLSTNTNLPYGFPMIFHRLRTNNYCMESIIWLTIRKVPTIASVNSSLLCIKMFFFCCQQFKLVKYLLDYLNWKWSPQKLFPPSQFYFPDTSYTLQMLLRNTPFLFGNQLSLSLSLSLSL